MPDEWNATRITMERQRLSDWERDSACCMDPEFRRTRPNPIRDQAMRTEIGRPNLTTYQFCRGG